MYKGSQGKCFDIVNGLIQKANDLDFQVKRSLENRKEVEKLTSDLQSEEESRSIAMRASVACKEVADALNEYINDKKKKGLNAIYAAIYSARSIIPDTSNLELIVDKELAYLANQEGFNVNKVEGSGFRAILSLFMRDRLIKSTNYIQTMFLDEALATLDPKNSAEMAKYLPLIAEDCAVVFIEQKDTVFESIEHTCYLFRKSEGYTTVRKERVLKGESDDGEA